MNKKILMVAYSTYINDARIIRESFAAYEEGYMVDFICLLKKGEKKKEIINGINILRTSQERYRGKSSFRYILSYLEFMIRCFFKITGLHIKNRYSIVHINNMPDFLVFSALIPKIFGASIILDIHDPMPNLFLVKMKNTWLKKVFFNLLKSQELISSAFARNIITVTEPVKHTLAGDGIRPERITVVANYADESTFTMREDYQIGEKIRMIYHGTIAERWGLQNILFALSEIEEKEKYIFKIIGEGDYSNELAGLIKKLRLEKIVEFDNRFYPSQEIAGLIRHYDVGVASLNLSPATDYALSTKMIEYILTGIPVLTIENTAAKYYLKGQGCIYYDPENTDSIAERLRQILNDRILLYGKRAEVLSIREKFKWEHEKKKYIKLLDSLSCSKTDGKSGKKLTVDGLADVKSQE